MQRMWGQKCSKLINEAIKNFLNMNQLRNGDLNKFVLLLRKGAYPLNTWIAGKDLMKHYQIKKLFTAN